MKTFTVQYSVPKGDQVCVSDWTEYTKKIKAKSANDAIIKFNKNRDGTWQVLDCWED